MKKLEERGELFLTFTVAHRGAHKIIDKRYRFKFFLDDISVRDVAAHISERSTHKRYQRQEIFFDIESSVLMR